MTDVMLEARDLVKRYDGVLALDRVSMEVRRGEVLGFLGPNGAGKSTTMKILTCFTAPTEGTAKVHGFDILSDSLGVRRSIGYLPESTALYHDMLVLEYLEWAAEMRGIKGADVRKRLKAVVEETGLGDVINKEIRALSKGFRQRVGLAQALIHEPPILILDEPMSGLDPNQAVEIRDLIKDIGKLRTVILSTHNLAEVQVACNRVLIISKGRIVADDTPAGLQDRAGKSRCVFSLLKSSDANFASQVESALAAIGGTERVRRLPSDEGEVSFEVFPKGSDDLRPALFKLAVDKGYTLVGLRREGQNLEQVFRELTTGTTPAAEKAAA
ncbi:MAG TPA: ATP-binding cassette domain-containing protein [Polyangiales bacterium]|jgi:ABC-2 type transport system ATP-binding protein|nr:ATP-binding cassette domain-containing protein [Polyangiales bacterium]